MTLCSRVFASMNICLLLLALTGCGDDDSPGTDSGVDSSTPTVDGSTPMTDGGPTPTEDGGALDSGVDAGPGPGRMCGAPGGECDVIAQDCPSPQTCVYGRRSDGDTTATTFCVDVNMRGDEGAACQYLNDCLPGLTCNDSVCRRYCCEGSASDCPAGSGQRCVGLSGGTSIGQCTQSVECDPVTNEGCAAGQGCYPFASDGTLGCFGAGDVRTEGAACSGLNGCAPGMGCFSRDSGPSECVRFCRIDRGDADCGSGRTCQAAGASLPTNVGLCPDAT